MPILAAFALANLKGDMAKLWSWLCHRSFWQLVSMALAGYALLQHFQLADARHDRDAYAKQLKAISSKKNEQTQVTDGNIAKAHEGQKRAEIIAKRIEAAPLPGNCKTPKEILDADI